MHGRGSPPLSPALPGERRELNGRAGQSSCYLGGAGPPLLLIHSINAAASAYEVKPIFEHALRQRRVYAPDLPGFGFSDRSPRDYTVQLYVDAIADVLDLIAAESGDERVDALALSLSSEFLARAALKQTDRFRALALVTPTGFSRGSARVGAGPGETREVPGLHALFTFPVWSQAFYDLLVSKRSIRYFLRRTWGSHEVDEALVEYDYLTAHQPGARHAPYAFVCGRLFSRNIRAVYERLTLPVWLAHGTRGDFRDFNEVDWVRARPNWSVRPFATGALPHFERPAEFLPAFDRFLRRARG
jgi:pimeloyl-ACP methyl ester carboxylesterase